MMLQFMTNLFTLSLKLQEVDEPLQLDMSELCLNDDFSQGNDGKHNCCTLRLLCKDLFFFFLVKVISNRFLKPFHILIFGSYCGKVGLDIQILKAVLLYS